MAERRRVTFAQPVVYLPGHVKSRVVTDLVVDGAPSDLDALIHAARVVAGDVTGAVVTRVSDDEWTARQPAPAVEDLVDPPTPPPLA